MGCQASEFEIMSRNNPQVHEAVDEVLHATSRCCLTTFVTGRTMNVFSADELAHTDFISVISQLIPFLANHLLHCHARQLRSHALLLKGARVQITYGETFDMELEEPSAQTSHRKVISIKPHDPDYVPVMARLKQMGYGEVGKNAGDEDGTRIHKRARKGDQVAVAAGTKGHVKKGRYDLCPPDESDSDREQEPSES